MLHVCICFRCTKSSSNCIYFKAIYEADAAAKSLLTDNATEPQQLRVIKRCELILNVVKRLHPALVAIMNNTSMINANYGKNGKGQGDTIHGT